MEDISPQELLNAWKKGKTLYAALFEFTAPEIRQEYDDLELERNNQNRDILDSEGMPAIALSLADFSKSLFLSGRIEQACNKLKWDLLNKILSEKVIVLGYETPLKSSDIPQIVPLHIWPQKIDEINWDDSSISKNGVRFLNIRVIKKLSIKKKIPDKKIKVAGIMDKKIGRPSLKEKIIHAYEHLKIQGNIDYSKTLKSHTESIQKAVQELFPEIKDTAGMKHEAIRRIIGQRFQDEKTSKPTSKL